jgi:hypothetical protein
VASSVSNITAPSMRADGEFALSISEIVVEYRKSIRLMG